MIELSPQQIAILERLIENGYAPVAFPLYANVVGIRKGSCAALLDTISGGGFAHFRRSLHSCLDGNLTVSVKDKNQSWLVWKTPRMDATPELLARTPAALLTNSGFFSNLTS